MFIRRFQVSWFKLTQPVRDYFKDCVGQNLLFRFVCNIVCKTPNELFVQPNIILSEGVRELKLRLTYTLLSVWLDLRTQLHWANATHKQAAVGKAAASENGSSLFLWSSLPPKHQHLLQQHSHVLWEHPASSNTCSGFLLLQKLLLSLMAGPFFLTSEYSIASEFNIQTLILLISLNDLQPHSFNTVWKNLMILVILSVIYFQIIQRRVI